MSATGSDRNLPVLDGLRAMSILLVLACHLLPLGPKALRLNETAGAMGMSLFFALSGFLITSGLMKNANIHEFVARRLSRILPLSYAYAAIVFLVFTFEPKKLFFTDLFTINYLTQYMEPGWTGHLWSLCVEIHFYLAIALVVLLLGKRGLWMVWPACLAITLLRVSAGTYGYISIATHLRVDEILSGACVATLSSYLRSNTTTRFLQGAMSVAALLWAVSADPFSGSIQYIRPYATAVLLVASLHYGAANPRTVLGSRPLRYIATISYALYVIHPATAQGWMGEGSTLVKYLLKRPISFALTFVLAHFSTFFWERPWQKAAKGWIQKRRQSAFEGIASSQAPSL
jgi:peptidoglycan/LPS O-acetylase OafA/YrhL